MGRYQQVRGLSSDLFSLMCYLLPSWHAGSECKSHFSPGQRFFLVQGCPVPRFPSLTEDLKPLNSCLGSQCCLVAVIHRLSPLIWSLVQTHICNVEGCVGIADTWKTHVLILVWHFWLKRSIWGRWNSLKLLEWKQSEEVLLHQRTLAEYPYR